MKLPKLDDAGELTDIDPFTVFGLFNKGITNANRISILKGFKDEFGLESAIPESFDGIPVLNNLSATFYGWCGGKLTKKKGQYGEFYGCENYQTNGCRFIRKISSHVN